MRRLMLWVPLLLCGCATPPPKPVEPEAVPGAPAPSLATLDGTGWRITLDPLEEGEKPSQDVLRFSTGKERQLMLPGFQKSAQFAPSAYTTPFGGEAGQPLPFEATLQNPAGESLSISGRATPDAVWGQIRVRHSDWTLRTYRFRGVPAR